jgi:hypothetical protein
MGKISHFGEGGYIGGIPGNKKEGFGITFRSILTPPFHEL